MESTHSLCRTDSATRDDEQDIVTISCTECLAAFAYYSPQHTSILATLLFAFIPAVILWWAFNLVQSYDESATAHKREIDHQIERNDLLKSEIENLTIQCKNLIENAAETLELYPPFRRLLDKETRQKKLIGHFLRKCISPVLCIWDIGDGDFYEPIFRDRKALIYERKAEVR